MRLTSVFLVIENAFHSTSNKIICETLLNHRILDALIDWTHNMLKGRVLFISHGNMEITRRFAKGCPQDGVLSPLLWCLVVNELLVELTRAGFMVTQTM